MEAYRDSDVKVVIVIYLVPRLKILCVLSPTHDVESEYRQNFRTISEEVLLLVRSISLLTVILMTHLFLRRQVKSSLCRMLPEQFLEVTAHLGYLAQHQMFLIFIAHPCDVSISVNNYFPRPF